MARATQPQPGHRRPSGEQAARHDPASRRDTDDVDINPTWHGLAMHTGPRIGRPDDPLEREADTVAERAMTGSTRTSGWTQLGLRTSPPLIQRACEACRAEEREIQRDAGGPSPSHASPAIGATLARRAGRGHALEPGLRASFESRLGADLSQVRTHTDGEAQQSARALQARAFTWGSDVYFGPGAWAPETRSGQRLLAHELAHVLQQDRGHTRAIQREPEFRVTDEVETSDRRPSDTNRIFFDYDSAVIEASQDATLTALITRLRAAAPAEIFLTGMASEEGATAHNRTLANRRIAAVEQRLRDAGFTRITRQPLKLAASRGRIEYRRERFVQVDTVRAEAGPECSSAILPVTRARDQASCDGAFNGAWPIATRICQAALDAMRSPSATTSTEAQAGLGVGSDREVIDLIQRVQAVLGRMGPSVSDLDAGQGHSCRDRCDTSCSTVASGGRNGISLCWPFYDRIAADLRPWVLIHEAAHGTGEFTDILYLHQRGFAGLSSGERQFNADSLTRVIVSLGEPGGATWNARRRAPGTTEPSGVSMTGPLGTLSMALLLSAYDQTFFYEHVRESQAAGAWRCMTGLPHAPNRRSAAGAIAGRFGMRPAPPASMAESCSGPVRPPPGSEDHVRLAAIVERLERMYDVVVTDLEVTEAATATAPRWRRVGGRWFIDVPPGYPGSRDADTAARELMRALIIALPDIEQRFADDYIAVAFGSLRSADLGSHAAVRTSRRADDPNWGTLPPASTAPPRRTP